MKNKHKIKRLLKSIKNSEAVYRQASRSVHSGNIRMELSGIKDQRKQYLNELLRKLPDLKNLTPVTSDLTIPFKWIWMKVNDLLIQRNVPNILITCVETDNRLLKSYQQLSGNDLDEDFNRLIRQQESEVKIQKNEFQDKIESYPWIST